MATSIPNGNFGSLTVSPKALAESPRAVVQPQVAARAKVAAPVQRQRKPSPETARGLEMLSHAIEYLSDEFALDCMDRILGTQVGIHPRLRAIELLKKCNRELYLGCPEVPTMSERIQGWFGRKKS